MSKHVGGVDIVFYVTVFVIVAFAHITVAFVFLEAEARSEDEPQCYSQACEKAQEERGETLTEEEVESSERVKEDLALELNASNCNNKREDIRN